MCASASISIIILTMRSHTNNSNSSLGYASAARSSWDTTTRPQPPPRRRANSLQHAPTMVTSTLRPTRRSLFNTTVVRIAHCQNIDITQSNRFFCYYWSLLPHGAHVCKRDKKIVFYILL